MSKITCRIAVMGFLLISLFAAASETAALPPVEATGLELKGRIDGENVSFILTFTLEARIKNARFLVADGELTYLSATLPDGAVLQHEGSRYWVQLKRKGPQPVTFEFAGLAQRDGDWRTVRCGIPQATVRHLSVLCDREDLELAFPGALGLRREKDTAGKVMVQAVLGAVDEFTMRWKPEVKALAAELAVTCEANTIATAGTGVLRLDTVFTWRVIQGNLKQMSLQLPPDLNVTQVRGADIREWSILPGPEKTRRLQVTLNREKDKQYLLQVEGEQVLPAFPCKFALPVAIPENVIRTSGFLLTGTDSAIKLIVEKAAGLTQVDQATFAVLNLEDRPRALPSRSAYACQYANLPYQLELAADDIVSVCSSEDRLVLTLTDNDLVFAAAVDLEVRDAPARDLVLLTDPAWLVANVSGENVADYDLKEKDGGRQLHVVFKQPVMGRTLLEVRLEKSLGVKDTAFTVPSFQVLNARSERGWLVLAAEKGVRLKTDQATALREVHTGSLPVKVNGAQQAFRFKAPDWKLSMTVEKTEPTIYAEAFHLTTLGEAALFGSCSITYHLEGAPVRTFTVNVPESCQNVEFTGRNIRGWERTGTEWQVSLQEKITGDYTLLVTYDRPFAFDGGRVDTGGVTTVGTENETGYLVLAGPAGLSVAKQGKTDPGLVEIERGEIPRAYALLINDPVLKAYKYVGLPHVAELEVKRFPAQPLLTQAADHTTFSTRLSRDGEAVTTAVYFVKNASQQYLNVRLPKGARLWSVKVDGKEVQALDQQSAGSKGLLVSLQRPQDPNQAARVELVYVESRLPLKTAGRLEFLAPVSAVQTVFSKWTVELPDDYAVAAAGGNMIAANGAKPGLLRLLHQVWWTWRTLGQRLPAAALLLAGLLLGLGLLAYARGRGRLISWKSFPGAALTAGCALLLLLGAGHFSHFLAGQVARGLFAKSAEICVFTRPVSLAGSEPVIWLEVVPALVGPGGSLNLLISAGAAGLVLLMGAVLLRRFRFSLGAATLTFFTLGLAATAATRPWTVLVLAAGVPFCLALVLLRRAWLLGRRRAADSDEAPPPFLPPEPVESSAGPPPVLPASGAAVMLFLVGWLNLTAVPGLAATESKDETKAVAPTTIEAPLAPVAKPAPAPQTVPVPPAPAPQTVPVPPAPAPQVVPTPPVPVPVLKNVEFQIEGPGSARETEKSARLQAVLTFSVDGPAVFPVLLPPAVLTEYQLNSPLLRLDCTAAGTVITVSRKGDYQITLAALVPVLENNGVWKLGFYLPPNLSNQTVLILPAIGLEVQAEPAVLQKTREIDGKTETRLVFGPGTQPQVTWQPRERKTRLEKPVVFSEVNSLAQFEPGVVTIIHQIRHQIAQGEVQAVSMKIPADMSVTAVTAPGLSTWRFEPDSRLLEALLEKPASGDLLLTVTTQMPQTGLPYEVTLSVPEIENSSRQRGTLAAAATEAVQIQVGEQVGLNPMSTGDFTLDAGLNPPGTGPIAAPAVKRAFRYHQLPVTARVKAERVMPELRVLEDARLDVSDERIVLSTKLEVAVSKSGIFSLRLNLPADYDIESLTGSELSHWDELKDAGHGVLVHFEKQVIGNRILNLVLSRMEKGIEESIPVPRVGVEGAVKHNGSLAVSGERGIRFLTVRREGVSEINPGELGIEQSGYLAFKLLRPDWTIVLKTEVIAPVVRVEMLQRITVTEGLLQGHGYLDYRIDNAGVKLFQIQAPQPGLVLAFSGRNITRTQETDKAKGIWQVELAGKVENQYSLEISYQMTVEAKDGRVRIVPLRTLGTESQKGYLTVAAGSRLRLRPETVPAGLMEEDARVIPPQFKAGDLSDSILCYRTTRPDYVLELSADRHSAADVLPATVDSVTLQSVVAEDGQVITRVQLEMKVGTKPFLRVRLPAGSLVWAVLVSGRIARPMTENGALLIPLEQAVADGVTPVEILYGGRITGGLALSRLRFAGPQFDLPLAEMQWRFYLPPAKRYYQFEGTMKYREPANVPAIVRFDDQAYLAGNAQAETENLKRAEVILKQGEQYAREGRQQEAKNAFESALYYSVGRDDFNEDVRIQYKNLTRQQAVVGLVNRRDNLRSSLNVQDETQDRQLKGFKDGRWTPEYGRQVQQSLSQADQDSLNRVAEKILAQQEAAAGTVHPIRISMPLQGKLLEFYRQLQLKPDTELVVSFKVFDPGRLDFPLVLAALAGLLLCYWLLGTIILSRE